MKTTGNSYLLWFEDSPKKTFEQIVLEGKERYIAKYGKQANFVHVFKDYDAKEIEKGIVEGCSIKIDKTMCINLFGFSAEESIMPKESNEKVFEEDIIDKNKVSKFKLIMQAEKEKGE